MGFLFLSCHDAPILLYLLNNLGRRFRERSLSAGHCGRPLGGSSGFLLNWIPASQLSRISFTTVQPTIVRAQSALPQSMKTNILLRHNLVALPAAAKRAAAVDVQLIGTVISNLAYYGYVLSKDATTQLTSVTEASLKAWWQEVEPVLKDVTGDNRRMGDFVVYKNFPQEVLDMTQAQYWFNQILMYWGLPNELFTAEPAPRNSLLEKQELKVLQPAAATSLATIFASLLKLPSRWTKDQLAWARFIESTESPIWSVTDIAFKENMALFVGSLIESGVKVKVRSATDVIRLAMGLSGGDVSFREPAKFKSFSKPVRRYFLDLLENTSALEEDVARDPERWKHFLKGLHPNDFRVKGRNRKSANKKALARTLPRKPGVSKPLFPGVAQAYNQLYVGKTVSFNGQIERLLGRKDSAVFGLLHGRPGDFVRRFNQTVKIFGARPAATQLSKVLPKLKTIQLLKLERYLATINGRQFRTIAPKGNWTKLQIQPSTEKLPKGVVTDLSKDIGAALRAKIWSTMGRSINLDPSAAMVKLQSNDGELSTIGRGTVFPIPANVEFIRTASYWRAKTGGHVWFDNGWNFFDANWKSVDTLCWNHTDMRGAAVFSGDPTNCKDPEGRACQMIDLYIDKLAAQGIRYGVWNILCFSGIKFKDAEVFGAFQWGQDAGSGQLFEPSRAQFAFPIAGDTLAKYILLLDVKERKLVYLDANLKANTSSASYNSDTLQTQMPAFMEYLDTLPSVYDLFKHGRKSKTGLPVSFTDAKLKLRDKEDAFVFKQVKPENSFKQVDLSPLLTA